MCRKTYADMRNMKTKQILCLMLIMLTACRADDTFRKEGTGSKITLSAQIEQLFLSRVNDNGFADGDEMGVYIVDYENSTPGTLRTSGNRADNLRYTFHASGSAWTSAYDVYFRDSNTPVDIYGYYPYASPSDVNQYAFYVQANQATPAQGGNLSTYEQSDFLWGKVEGVQPTGQEIRLPLHHRMSCARVTLKEGLNFSEGEWSSLSKSVILRNVTRYASVSLASGGVVAQGSADAQGIIPFCSGDEYRAIVVPQAVEGGQKLFDITVGQTSYSFSKDDTFTFTSGRMHNFTITVDRKSDSGDFSFRLTDESISPWEADLASHEAEAKEYVVVHVPASGALQTALADAGKDYTKVQNLKLTGRIGVEDFRWMRSMKKLCALNLKEVRCDDDVIPADAFCGENSEAHLYTLLLPDTLTAIGDYAFKGQMLVGSLQIPEGVTTIGEGAFANCKSLTGTLSLSSVLQTIGRSAFSNCNFSGELLLPQSLKRIGDAAFFGCSYFSGRLTLPSGLQEIGAGAFQQTQFSDALVIPQSASVGTDAFAYCDNFNRLVLHDGITEIADGAFYKCQFRGGLTLPKNLLSIGDNAFYENSYLSGTLELPETLVSIGSNAFRNCIRLTGTLEIPKNVIAIREYAFHGCVGLNKIVLPEKLEIMQAWAFGMCTQLQTVVCKATTPPTLSDNVFYYTQNRKLTVEVPEQAVDAYRLASGWRNFHIVAYHEIACSPSSVAVLNKEQTRTIDLNAEGAWEVTAIPSWCRLNKTSGFGPTQLTLTIDALARGGAQRTDSIRFALKEQENTAACVVSQYDYEYAEDATVTLQSATKGTGVNLVFLGDGFTASSISDGTYLKKIRQRVEEFFAVEPYTTYRDWFNVYTCVACSDEEGVGVNNRFGTAATDGVTLQCESSRVFDYVLQVPGVTKTNLPQTLVVIVPNTNGYDGNTQLWPDGSAISICPESLYSYPNDSRGITQHEAGGHGFGKLGDEAVRYASDISTCKGDCSLSAFREAKARGWYENLSLTGKSHEVPWSHYLSMSKYNAKVDVYEGGYGHQYGVFRSEENSCMSTCVPYFNVISREAIVKRIMQYGGASFVLDDFIKNDK